MSKRSRDPLDDPRPGPSKNALRGLSYVGQQPKFLQNAMAALSGQPSSGREPVPTRPDRDGEGQGNGDSDDELDGATVVVLKEGKHFDQEEVDRLRADAKANDALDPFAAGAAEPARAKNTGSLSFSTGGGADGKPRGGKGTGGGGAGQGDWADVVKRSKEDDVEKGDGVSKAAAAPTPAKTAEEMAREKEKEDRRRKKEKKTAKQKISRLTFGDEEE